MKSSNRKLYLSGWLENNCTSEYSSSLKLQKFLFLYEAFSKVDKDEYDFSSLEAWQNGTVFYDVWCDYTRNRYEFNRTATNEYFKHKKDINYNRVKICSFIVSILNENDLSELTHQFHMWNSKENMIKKHILHIKLDDRDFNNDDMKLVKLLNSMYPVSFIDNVAVIRIDGNSFIISKEQHDQLTDTHFDTLVRLTYSGQLTNPTYIEIDEKGRLLVD